MDERGQSCSLSDVISKKKRCSCLYNLNLLDLGSVNSFRRRSNGHHAALAIKIPSVENSSLYPRINNDSCENELEGLGY